MFKQWRIAFIVTVLTMLSVIISACGSTSTASGTTPTPTSGASLGTPGALNCISGSISASGSTALAPLAKKVATGYESHCSGAQITINLGGSGTGLANAESGTSDIGNSDVFKKTGQDDLVDHQVAVVVFALIINSKITGVTNLTTAQLKGIYSGQTTNWKQVGGPDLNIVVVTRPASSGTRGTFQKYIVGGPETVSGPSNLQTDSTSTVIQNVQQTDGAIGYTAIGPAKQAGATIIQIDGAQPVLSTVKDNTYKFWGFEHMYTKGQPSKQLAQAFIDYMSSTYGKQQAQALGFLEPSDIDAAASQAHQK